jgi:hypothetical protein
MIGLSTSAERSYHFDVRQFHRMMAAGIFDDQKGVDRTNRAGRGGPLHGSGSVQRKGFVVLNRNWERSWSASRPYKVTSFNGLIAARVGPGNHTIRFDYRPRIVAIGFGVSVLSLVAVVIWSLRGHRTRIAETSTAKSDGYLSEM